MERPREFTMVRHNGEIGWKLPYSYKLLPSSATAGVVVVDPKGITRLVSRKALALH
jgi:hypothetical protein